VVGGETLSALGYDGTLVEVDGVTRAVRRVRGVAIIEPEGIDNQIAADADGTHFWSSARADRTRCQRSPAPTRS